MTKQTEAQKALNNPNAIWNHVEAMQEALPWLHELAMKSAKTDAQKKLAAFLPSLISTGYIAFQAEGHKNEALDDLRSAYMRMYLLDGQQQADAKARAKAKGDPHQ